MTMLCYVYRSRRKPGTFLFLAEQDNFSCVPAALLQLFGTPEFSFSFLLDTGRKLIIRAEPAEIRRLLVENGFYLQLPPGDELSC